MSNNKNFFKKVAAQSFTSYKLRTGWINSKRSVL